MEKIGNTKRRALLPSSQVRLRPSKFHRSLRKRLDSTATVILNCLLRVSKTKGRLQRVNKMKQNEHKWRHSGDYSAARYIP